MTEPDDDGLRIMMCMRPEHMDSPYPAPGSTKDVCASCDRTVWIAPSSRNVMAFTRAQGHDMEIRCCCCADMHGLPDMVRKRDDMLLHLHDWTFGTCPDCGMTLKQFRSEVGM